MTSIIIPVYRTAATLMRCVESIAAQQDARFEMILVDDGSPDSCPAMCDSLAAADSRIRVIHKPNGGLSSARNAGIEASRGDLLMFVDSDDHIAPGTLSALSRLAGEHPEYDIIEFPICREMPSGRQEMTDFGCREYRDMDEYWLSCRAYMHAYACNKIYRRALFDGIRYPENMIFEDIHTLPLLMNRAGVIATTDKGTYHYRWNSAGISNNAGGEAWRTLLATHIMMLRKTRRRSDEWTEYYMHVLNIQIYTSELTGDRPTLPTVRQGLCRVDRRWRLKALLLYVLGVRGLCRANRMLRTIAGRRQKD